MFSCRRLALGLVVVHLWCHPVCCLTGWWLRSELFDSFRCYRIAVLTPYPSSSGIAIAVVLFLMYT